MTAEITPGLDAVDTLEAIVNPHYPKELTDLGKCNVMAREVTSHAEVSGIFFPELPTGRPKKVQVDPYKEAKGICNGCQVQKLCLQFAMEQESLSDSAERYGVWGGLDPRQRHALSRGRRYQSCKRCGNSFLPTTSGNRAYCSDECKENERDERDKEYNARRRHRRRTGEDGKFTIRCGWCSTKFTTTMSQRRYCSAECKLEGKRRSARESGARNLKPCVECGDPIRKSSERCVPCEARRHNLAGRTEGGQFVKSSGA